MELLQASSPAAPSDSAQFPGVDGSLASTGGADGGASTASNAAEGFPSKGVRVVWGSLTVHECCGEGMLALRYGLLSHMETLITCMYVCMYKALKRLQA